MAPEKLDEIERELREPMFDAYCEKALSVCRALRTAWAERDRLKREAGILREGLYEFCEAPKQGCACRACDWVETARTSAKPEGAGG